MEIIKPENLNKNVFSLIGLDWFLISAEKDGKTNALTASWGQMGQLWNKWVVTVYVRPQRYTKEFIDHSERFSLSFFDGQQEALSYIGTHSGRDIPDKTSVAGLHSEFIDGVPTFKEANLIFICRKLYVQPLKKECFLNPQLADRNYKNGDFSVAYVAEIEKIYRR